MKRQKGRVVRGVCVSLLLWAFRMPTCPPPGGVHSQQAAQLLCFQESTRVGTAPFSWVSVTPISWLQMMCSCFLGRKTGEGTVLFRMTQLFPSLWRQKGAVGTTAAGEGTASS
jgi:hypothetical protein